ncbi:MAG: hypothetical protein KA105_01840 [Caulobacter sp.]|nr:hypothetical protein [Caulobacter sp.]
MILRTTLCALALVLVAGAAQAAPHGQADFVRDYDTDKDGVVTKAEYEAIRVSRLKAMDVDGDGRVSETEYVGEYAARLEAELAASTGTDKDAVRAGQMKQAHVRYGVMDSDKNGDLTAAEFNASGARAFASHDGDGDGVVKAGEAKKTEN